MPARTDATQAAIVAALRAAGCSVQSLHTVGGGVPDLLVGRAGVNYLLECKVYVGLRRPKMRRLRETQFAWHWAWVGQVAVVATIEEAFAVVGIKVAA